MTTAGHQDFGAGEGRTAIEAACKPPFRNADFVIGLARPPDKNRGLREFGTRISEIFLNTKLFFIRQILANTLHAFSEPAADQSLRSPPSFQSDRKLSLRSEIRF